MSSETENLGLFKYDPVADKDQTFNIDLALNQNWDTVDKEMAQREVLLKSSASKEAIADTDAVAVVDSTDSSKTKRVLWSTIKSALSKIYVPLTRKINSKSLSSDVTLTGADIQVSGTDNTKIDAALSNKADKVVPQKHELQVLDNWKTSTFSPSTYGKTQESIVFVEFRLSPIENMGTGVHDFAMLPEGFRPKNDTYFLIASQSMFINAWVKSSGHIRLTLSNELEKEDEIKGLVSFIAEN